MLTHMILWMKKAARSMKQHLQDSVQSALNHGSGQGWALVGMAFLAVAREGLKACFPVCRVPAKPDVVYADRRGIGAVGGGCHRYADLSGRYAPELGEVFSVGQAFLIVVAAGLLAGSFRALHEAGVWNAMQDIAFDTSKYLHEDSPLGVLLGGFFGYTDHPTEGEVLIWLLYLVPVMIWFLRGSAPAKTLTK